MPFVRLLAWMFGLGVGVAAAVWLGPYVPTWGAALAFPVATSMLVGGSYFETEDAEPLTHFSRAVVGFALGFLSATMLITFDALTALAETRDPIALDEARSLFAILLPRWAFASLGPLLGVAGLTLRQLRGAKRRTRTPASRQRAAGERSPFVRESESE